MNSDLGVLLALCLKENPEFSASYQTLLDDLAHSGSIPKRLSWEGDETAPGPQDLVISRPVDPFTQLRPFLA